MRMAKRFSILAALACVVVLWPQSARSDPHNVVVSIHNYAFQPQTVKIAAGDSVTFENDDYVAHNVTADTFKSGEIAGGKSWQYTFDKAGSYTYTCTDHAGMQGTIVVTGSTPGAANSSTRS